MNIKITGRHITVTPALQDYATRKIEKLQRYFQQLFDVHVVMYLEKLDRGVEVLINGDGVQFHGRENSETFFASIDLLIDKLEKQIVKYKGKMTAHKGMRNEIPDELLRIEREGEPGVTMNQVSPKPVDKIEAFLQMKNGRNDFILFKMGVDIHGAETECFNKCYALIFRDGDDYRMAEVPHEDGSHEESRIIEYNINVIDETPANPNIRFKKAASSTVKSMSLDEAIDSLQGDGLKFVPFYNRDSRYFNVVYKSGGKCEVMVPAF